MSIKDILEEESRRLGEVISKAMMDLNRAPEGNLVTGMCRGYLRFYHKTWGSSKRTYLSQKNDMELIRALAQKRYATKVLNVACAQKTAIDKFISEYNPQAIHLLAGNLGETGLVSLYTEQDDDSPFSVNPVPAVDLSLVSRMMDLCSRILNRSAS